MLGLHLVIFDALDPNGLKSAVANVQGDGGPLDAPVGEGVQ